MAQEVSYIIRARDSFSNIHKKADKTIDKTAQTFKRGAGVMTIAVGGVSASLFAMMKTTANSADHLSKLEARLGVSAEGFSSLAYAAEMSDISMSTLEMSMQRQTRRLSEAAQGTGQAVAALDTLGLSAKALKDMKPEEAFMKIAAEMEKVPSKADRARIAMQLWDTEGVKLNQMIADGTENIEALRERAELLGLTFDSQTAAASARLNDEIADLGNMAIGVKNTFSKDLIPYFGEFAGLINESLMEIKKSGDLDKWAADMAEGVIIAFSATAEVATNMPMVWHASMVSVKTIAADGVAIIDTVLLGVEKFYGVMAMLPGTIGQPYQMAVADINEMRGSLSDIGTDLLISADANSKAGEKWGEWALKAQSSIDAVRNKVAEGGLLSTAAAGTTPTKPTGELTPEADPQIQATLLRMQYRDQEIEQMTSFTDAMAYHAERGVAITEAMAVSTVVANQRMAWSAQARASLTNKANSAMQDTMLGLIETGKFSVGAFAKIMAQQVKIELTGIAAKAGIQALYYTGRGFAALAGYEGPSAANWFTAAGLMTGIAAASLAAGSAVNAVAGGSAEKPAAGTAGGEPVYTQPSGSLIASSDQGSGYRPGEGQQVTYHIHAVDAKSFKTLVEENPAAITGVINQDIKDGGKTKDVIRRYA